MTRRAVARRHITTWCGRPDTLECYINPLFREQKDSLEVYCAMLLNTTVISADAAFVISNLQSNTVLDLSATNEIDSTSSASEIICRFDALTQLPDGLIMEEAINKCVERHIRNSIQ